MIDPLGMIEVQLARALRALDMAAMVAETIKSQPARNATEQRRVNAAARRIEAVRQALSSNEIRLPPLRQLGQHDRKYGIGGELEDLQR